MSEPLISVIVPVYNVEKYIAACVDSILAQTYTNLEILLVDDGSTDSSGALCDEYARRDVRVRVIHQESCYGTQTDKHNSVNSEKIYRTEEGLRQLLYQRGMITSAWGRLFDASLFMHTDAIQFPVGKLHEDVAVMYKLFGAVKQNIIIFSARTVLSISSLTGAEWITLHLLASVYSLWRNFIPVCARRQCRGISAPALNCSPV